MKTVKENWFTLVAVIMLLLAIPPIWPYGYFQLLRLVVTGVAFYNAYTAHESKNKAWVVIMGAIAILFNPLFPIHLDKEVWVVLDIISAVLMFISINKIKK